MSFDSDPSDYDYSVAPNECPACFAAGKTPEKIFICFSGIELGDDWMAPMHPPPNGIWELDVDGPCSWSFAAPLIAIDYHPSPINTLLTSLEPPAWSHFHYDAPPTCGLWLANDQLIPVNQFFYGGFAMIIDPTVTGPLTESDLLEFMDDAPNSTLWCNPRPKTATETVYTFSRRSDSSNMKIRYDHT